MFLPFSLLPWHLLHSFLFLLSLAPLHHHLHRSFLSFIPLLLLPQQFILARTLQQPLNRPRKGYDRRQTVIFLSSVELFAYFFSLIPLSSSLLRPTFFFDDLLSISRKLSMWREDLNKLIVTAFILWEKFVSFFIYFLFDINFVLFNLNFSCISFEFIAWRQAVFVFATITIVWAAPVPTILIFFHCLEEKFAHDIRSASFHYLSFLLSNHLVQFFFSKLTELLSSYCIHNKLSSLVNIKVDFLGPIQSEVVRVDTFFSLLAKTLFEVRTDNVGRVFVFVRIISFESIDISIERIEEGCFFLFLFSQFSFLKLLAFEFGHGDTLMFDGSFYSFDESS